MKKSELRQMIREEITLIKQTLTESTHYKVWVISIGVPALSSTGKTKYGWSIFSDKSTAQVYLSSGGTLLYGSGNGKEFDGASIDLYDNDSQRAISSGMKIIDSSQASRDSVLKMLKRNGYDYYPLAPYQKKRRNQDISNAYSIKGYTEQQPTVIYDRTIASIAYDAATSFGKSNKEIVFKQPLSYYINTYIKDNSPEATKLFLQYANTTGAKKTFLQNAQSHAKWYVNKEGRYRNPNDRFGPEVWGPNPNYKSELADFKRMMQTKILDLYKSGGFLDINQ